MSSICKNFIRFKSHLAFVEGIALVQKVTFDSMLSTGGESSVETKKVQAKMEGIRKIIRKTAYSIGWEAISFFGTQNNSE